MQTTPKKYANNNGTPQRLCAMQNRMAAHREADKQRLARAGAWDALFERFPYGEAAAALRAT